MYTRAELYRFTKKHDIDKQIVTYAADSVACQKKIPNLDSKELDKMKLDKEGQDMIFLSNGFYRFNDSWKQRGLGKLGTKEIEHLDTFEKDGRLYYRFNVLRNNRLRSSIRQNKILDIGKIKPSTREFNLNADRKRFWLGRIESIDDRMMNESVPLSLNHILKTRI